MRRWLRSWYLALRGGKPYRRAMEDLQAQLEEWS